MDIDTMEVTDQPSFEGSSETQRSEGEQVDETPTSPVEEEEEMPSAAEPEAMAVDEEVDQLDEEVPEDADEEEEGAVPDVEVSNNENSNEGDKETNDLPPIGEEAIGRSSVAPDDDEVQEIPPPIDDANATPNIEPTNSSTVNDNSGFGTSDSGADNGRAFGAPPESSNGNTWGTIAPSNNNAPWGQETPSNNTNTTTTWGQEESRPKEVGKEWGAAPTTFSNDDVPNDNPWKNSSNNNNDDSNNLNDKDNDRNNGFGSRRVGWERNQFGGDKFGGGNDWSKKPSRSFDRTVDSGWGMNRDRAARLSQGNDVPGLLPPLGRSSPQKIAARHARRATFAPYSFSGRDRDNPREQGPPDFPDYLNYDTTTNTGSDSQPKSPVGSQQEPVKLDLVSRFKMMDMSSFGNEMMGHMKMLMKLYAKEKEARDHLQTASSAYRVRKSEYEDQIRSEMDDVKKARLMADLAAYKTQMAQQEQTLCFLIETAEGSLKREMDATMKTVANTLSEKIQASVLEILRAIGGPACDIEAIVEKCVNLTAPQLVRDYIPSQENLIKAMERKILKMHMALKEKDETIAALTSRMDRIEKQMQNVNPASATVPGSSQDIVLYDPLQVSNNGEGFDVAHQAVQQLAPPSPSKSSSYSSVLASFVTRLSTSKN